MAESDRWNNRLKAVAVGLGLALTVLTVRHWWSIFTYGHPPCSDCLADFPQFYAGAKLIWQNPSALYKYEHQLAIQKMIDSRIGESTQPFAYPPFTALVMMPLGWVPFSEAFAAMAFVNVGLLSLALILLIRKLDLKKDQSVWLLLTTFCNFGVHSALLQGQTSIIMLSCLSAFMFAVRGGKQFAAGFWSGCIFLKPQLLAVPFIAIVFQRLWKAFCLASVVLMALCTISILLVGRSGVNDYLQLLKFYATTENGFGSYPQYMHNLRALVQYYVPFSYARYIWLALVVLIAAFTMWLNANPHSDARNTSILWIGNFLAMMLITPHFYPHDLVLMIVPSAFILKIYDAPIPWFVPSLLILVGVIPVLVLAVGNQVPPVMPMIFLVGYFLCIWTLWKAAKPESASIAALD